MRRARRAALGALVLLAGCAVGPSYRTPRPDVPAAYAALSGPAATRRDAPSSGPVIELARWWRALGDAELDSLVDRAVSGNLDIEDALLRLQQARTYEAVVVGHALPGIDASAGEGRGTGSDMARGRASQGLVSGANTAGLAQINTLAGFDAVWQLDLFGGYRRAIQAARFDTQAAAAARYGVITAVVADVVRAYLDLRAAQLQVSILDSADEVLKESLRIVTTRYERGITNELDVTLAARELDQLQAQIAPAQAQVQASEYTLAVLLGSYPESLMKELSQPALMPVLPDSFNAGVPLELLRRRPDIQQAERSLGAATARIGVATATLFPQVGLVGSLGAQQGQVAGSSRQVGQHLWSFGPGAVWPLLDFGALDAEVDIADLEARRSLVAYRETILRAVQEVDTAVDGFSSQQSRVQVLNQALVAAERAVELATHRYNRGLTDYLNVVDAERQLYEIEQQDVSAQLVAAEQFVALYRSLGGGWEDYRAVPAIREPQPAVLAAFRRLLSSNRAFPDQGSQAPP